MSPGRAWAALTICRLSWWVSECCTQVCTAAQPLPGILWPACSSDHVTKLAHHGLPGATWAAARYLSTSAPVLYPVSWTCFASSPFATSSADAPRLLPPPAETEAASATAGTASAGASALGGPAGGCTTRNAPEAPSACLEASAAVTTRNEAESPILRGS